VSRVPPQDLLELDADFPSLPAAVRVSLVAVQDSLSKMTSSLRVVQNEAVASSYVTVLR
jgi:hypothetical protein